MTNIQPTTNEELVILEEWHFETISRQMALELIARIRADARRIMEIDNALETQHKATYDLWNERNELYKKLASVEARAARLTEALRTLKIKCEGLICYDDRSCKANDLVDDIEDVLSTSDAQR